MQAQDFGATADKANGGVPVAEFPSIDLAVVDLTHRGGPRWANVLFSREFPRGLVAAIDEHAGAVRNVRYDADLRDEHGESIAWRRGAEWSKLPFKPITMPPPGPVRRFVAPYPASLLKLMVAVGVAISVDRGLAAWPAALAPMITASDNAATDECIALLHRVGLLDPTPGNALNSTLASWGLPTLQLNSTTPAGGWRNDDGAGVGRIHMTAWDTARLLWLLDPLAPPAPWRAPGAAGPGRAAREALLELLSRQQLDHVLSSGSLRGVPGWVPGLPDAPRFAHKTGTTENYASDAGIVADGGRRYIVAVLTSLGRRYAPHERCATTWRLPALGAAIDTLLAAGAD